VNKRVALIGEPLRCPPHQRYAATYQWRRVAQEGQLPSDNGKRTSEEQIPHRLDRYSHAVFPLKIRFSWKPHAF